MADLESDPWLVSVQLLTETWQRLAERRELAENQAAAVATAATALGTLTITQADTLNRAEAQATVAFIALIAAVVASLFARLLGRPNVVAMFRELVASPRRGEHDKGVTDADKGGKPREAGKAGQARKRKPMWRRVWSEHKTAPQRETAEKLQDLEWLRAEIKRTVQDESSQAERSLELKTRVALLDYWHARATSDRKAYDTKRLVVTLAAGLLVVALAFLAWAGLKIL